MLYYILGTVLVVIAIVLVVAMIKAYIYHQEIRRLKKTLFNLSGDEEKLSRANGWGIGTDRLGGGWTRNNDFQSWATPL